ncbi:MAG: sterol desaturase family protein [Bacteroidia bacterium]|nr:sterol desaturase family protein [Bacteroidia bacterium]
MAGIPFLIFYVLYPGKFSRQKIQERWVKQKDLIHEVLHSLKSMIIFIAAAWIAHNNDLGGYSRIYTDVNDYPIWWLPASILLIMLIYDTYFYWLHRAMHHKAFFRWTHLVHHKSTNPTPLATYSFNVIEAIMEAAMGFLIFILMPVHLLALLFTVTLTFAFNVYAHLGYEVMPRWFRRSFLFEILVTSVHHNLHHHKFKGNYGLYFRFWDRIMHTEHPDYVKTYDRIQEKRFGASKVNEMKRAHFPLLLLMIPLVGTSFQENSALEGVWRDDVGGGIVSIYKDGDYYQGKLIGAIDPKKDAKVKRMNFHVLENFKMENEKEFCCGKLAHPNFSFKVDGKLRLKDDSTLVINGQVGFFMQTRVWKKIGSNE